MKMTLSLVGCNFLKQWPIWFFVKIKKRNSFVKHFEITDVGIAAFQVLFPILLDKQIKSSYFCVKSSYIDRVCLEYITSVNVTFEVALIL